eukprot:gb/GECG01012706.1/.p1 GENE.gb/GECG01012706.1/~~gb/GECG01012706.1/.p1  ORF type:complete len:109 (+),score=18.94 gb/GECG01012706.1/:1-327(+)
MYHRHGKRGKKAEWPAELTAPLKKKLKAQTARGIPEKAQHVKEMAINLCRNDPDLQHLLGKAQRFSLTTYRRRISDTLEGKTGGTSKASVLPQNWEKMQPDLAQNCSV